MWLNEDQFVSLPLLGLTVALVARTGSADWRIPLWYGFVVGIYLMLATICAFWSQGDAPLSLTRGPLGSVLIVMAVFGACAALGERSIEQAVRAVAILSGVTAFAVIMSPWLSINYINPPPDPYRFSGFFANPNEAGAACVLGFAFAITAYNIARAKVYIALACSLAVATVLTLSKGAMVALLLVMAYATFAEQTARRALAVTFVCLTVLAAFALAFGAATTAEEYLRHERISELLKLLALQFDADTTTNRTVVWKTATDQIGDGLLVFGDGLGSMRVVKGGLLEDGTWGGVHNFWLMILGEAGAFVLVVFVTAYVLFLWNAIALCKWRFPIVAYCIVLTVETFSSHGIFELRFHAVLVGLSLATIYHYGRSSTFAVRRAISGVNV